ncbi:hypothetical protein BWR15_14730 [Pseudomonas sp. T]|nr:hypothetical protein BWR15_14730 [Pseudomonas sp. T]
MTRKSLADGGLVVDVNRPGSKIANILKHFVDGGSLNRFEAERLGDHTLNSTIASLSGQYGLLFIRTRETVKNRFGSKTPVTRYRLPEHEMKRAAKLLAILRNKSRHLGGAK